MREAWGLYIERLGTLLGITVIPAAVIVGLVALLAGGGIIGSTFLPSQFVTGNIGVLIFLGILLIPAILLSTVFFSLNTARGKALDARRESDLQRIRLGLELYHQERGIYPVSLDELSPRYLPEAPVDPETNTGYRYQLQSETSYKVCVPNTAIEKRVSP